MAKETLCAAPGCGNAARSAGCCTKHYLRRLRHGTFDVPGTGPERGSVGQWLDTVAVPHTGDDCLTFPFGKDRHGYGHISAKGRLKTSGAHIYVALVAIGPKPSDRHEVCHTCGNGHLACVNPKHLYWGTRAENVADARKHGTFSNPPKFRGAGHPNSRLKEEDVHAIRERLARGATLPELADAYGVTSSAIQGIKYGHTWRHS